MYPYQHEGYSSQDEYENPMDDEYEIPEEQETPNNPYGRGDPGTHNFPGSNVSSNPGGYWSATNFSMGGYNQQQFFHQNQQQSSRFGHPRVPPPSTNMIPSSTQPRASHSPRLAPRLPLNVRPGSNPVNRPFNPPVRRPFPGPLRQPSHPNPATPGSPSNFRFRAPGVSNSVRPRAPGLSPGGSNSVRPLGPLPFNSPNQWAPHINTPGLQPNTPQGFRRPPLPSKPNSSLPKNFIGASNASVNSQRPPLPSPASKPATQFSTNRPVSPSYNSHSTSNDSSNSHVTGSSKSPSLVSPTNEKSQMNEHAMQKSTSPSSPPKINRFTNASINKNYPNNPPSSNAISNKHNNNTNLSKPPFTPSHFQPGGSHNVPPNSNLNTETKHDETAPLPNKSFAKDFFQNIRPRALPPPVPGNKLLLSSPKMNDDPKILKNQTENKIGPGVVRPFHVGNAVNNKQSLSKTESDSEDKYLIMHSPTQFAPLLNPKKPSNLSKNLTELTFDDGTTIPMIPIYRELLNTNYFYPIKKTSVKKYVTEGKFLLRPSASATEEKPLILCVLHNGRKVNINIQKTPDGQYGLGTKKKDIETFETVGDLIEYYKKEHFFLIDGFPVILKQPAGL